MKTLSPYPIDFDFHSSSLSVGNPYQVVTIYPHLSVSILEFVNRDCASNMVAVLIEIVQVIWLLIIIWQMHS